MIKEDGTSTIKVEQTEDDRIIVTDERYDKDEIYTIVERKKYRGFVGNEIADLERDMVKVLVKDGVSEVDGWFLHISIEAAYVLRDLLNAALHAKSLEGEKK